METTKLTSGNLTGLNNQGLPDRMAVTQAQKAFSMNAKFWVLIKNGRIPYKIENGKLIEATYSEVVKSFHKPPVMVLYWMTDEEVSGAQVSAEALDKALKIAGEETEKLNTFRKD